MKRPCSYRGAFAKAVFGAMTVAVLIRTPRTAHAESPLTISLDVQSAHPGLEVSPDFVGVSYETQMLLPSKEGKHYFGPSNTSLVAMFKALGIKSLRVGGNTADRPAIPLPSHADIDELFAFAKATDAKVIYTLRMREGDPKDASQTAKYILDHYADRLTCFAIGNEPNVFAKEYPTYRKAWEDYADAVVAAAPGAKFCGPSATPGKADWARQFVADEAKSGRVVLITQHDYPGASAKKVTDVAAAREQMLSAGWVEYNEKFYRKFVPQVEAARLPFRLEEANSFFNGGAKDVSDTLASALWALDYMYWWASHGAAGINFHTGDTVASGEGNATCRYAVFTSASNGYAVRPIAYALKAFDISSHGRLVPANIVASNSANMTAYAVETSPATLTVALINKDHRDGHDAIVVLSPKASYGEAQVTFLAGPGSDISATSGVTLGGAAIQDDGSWQGNWKRQPPTSDGKFEIVVPAATAAIVKLVMFM
jgi:hypothetical protein